MKPFRVFYHKLWTDFTQIEQISGISIIDFEQVDAGWVDRTNLWFWCWNQKPINPFLAYATPL